MTVQLDRCGRWHRGRGHHLLGGATAHRHQRRDRSRHLAVGRLHRRRRRRVAAGAHPLQRPRVAAVRAARRARLGVRAARRRPGLARRRLAGLPPPHPGRPCGRLHARPRSRRAVDQGLRRGAVPEAGRPRRRGSGTRAASTCRSAPAGLTLNTQSLVSVLAGGLAFERAAGRAPGTAGADEQPCSRWPPIAPRRSRRPAGPPLPVRMVFDQSVRGLATGAPIDFLGVEVGRVRKVALQLRRHSATASRSR